MNEIFDEISYCKGAACIMMITSYLGMELFRKGICAYLEKHKYIFFQKKIFDFFYSPHT